MMEGQASNNGRTPEELFKLVLEVLETKLQSQNFTSMFFVKNFEFGLIHYFSF